MDSQPQPNSQVVTRQASDKAKLLEALRKSPIVQAACQQSGISRATYYRWRKEDPRFAAGCDAAIEEGAELVSDMAESKLITSIKEQNFNAISFWLRKRSPKFRDRLEVVAATAPQDALTPEQESVVKEALRLASLSVERPLEEPAEAKPIANNANESNPPNKSNI